MGGMLDRLAGGEQRHGQRQKEVKWTEVRFGFLVSCGLEL